MHLRFAPWLAFMAIGSAALAADAWVQRVGNGFGDANNKGVEWLQVFNGRVYAAVGQDNTGSGNAVSVFQSTDLITWTRVLGPLAGQTDVFFGVANSSAIFFGTKASAPPGQIWRSTDGTNWAQFNTTTSGFQPAGNIIVAALGIFGSNLYAGFNNPNGGQVWRRPVDGSANWTRVVEFANGTGLGGSAFAVSGVSPTYLYVSRGVLYLSTVSSTVATNPNGPQLAFLYQSTDGMTWTRNAAVGNGFGDANNLNIASLVEFGDFLYASVHNRTTGGQVWRTSAAGAAANSATAWQKVVGNDTSLRDGFGTTANNPDDHEVHHLDVGLGFLWVMNININGGSQVWRSSDGVNWTQSNQEGFIGGSNVRRGFPTVELFNNQMVWGGSSTAGAQVWSLPATGITTTNPPPALIAPTITTRPASQTATTGANISFTVVATGSTPLSYQWTKNGVAIVGATEATLTLNNVQASDVANYDVIVSNAAGSVRSVNVTLTVTPAPPPGPTARLANLSVRTALAPSQSLIVGMVVFGGPRNILIRAAGPALTKFGISDVMADPQILLFPSGAFNDNWADGNAATTTDLVAAFAQVGAFPFDVGSKDATILQSQNGVFSILCRGDGLGVVLVETYDVSASSTGRLVNVSARNRVRAGDDILIAGFNIAGTGAKQVLIRAVGPKLLVFGVSAVLADPKLELFDQAGAKIAENDNWSAALEPSFTAVGAFALDPGSKDAALLATLAPGSYTAQIKGADGGTGEALVEIYEVP